MGVTPAKTFPPPMPFGSSPAQNNVSQATPYQQVSGPGFAPASAYDQTQAQGQQTPAAGIGALFSPGVSRFRINRGNLGGPSGLME